MIGVSESYFGAFAVDLGYDDGAIALLTTIPILVGMASQLASSWLVRRAGGRRRLSVAGAVIQASSQVALLTIAWTQDRGFWLFLAAKTVFWISGSAIAPAWNSWMATLTEGVDRERYFARRSALAHAALLIAFIAAGVWLDLGEDAGCKMTIYALLFALAFAARSLSAFSIWRMQEPLPLGAAGASAPSRIRESIRLGRWRIALFIGVFMFGVHIATPFFTPYMLRDLKMSMLQFALLTVSPSSPRR